MGNAWLSAIETLEEESQCSTSDQKQACSIDSNQFPSETSLHASSSRQTSPFSIHPSLITFPRQHRCLRIHTTNFVQLSSVFVKLIVQSIRFSGHDRNHARLSKNSYDTYVDESQVNAAAYQYREYTINEFNIPDEPSFDDDMINFLLEMQNRDLYVLSRDSFLCSMIVLFTLGLLKTTKCYFDWTNVYNEEHWTRMFSRVCQQLLWMKAMSMNNVVYVWRNMFWIKRWNSCRVNISSIRLVLKHIWKNFLFNVH